MVHYSMLVSGYRINNAVVVESTGSTSSVNYDVTIQHALDVDGSIRTKKYMYIERDATIDGRLFVNSDVSLNGSISMSGTLSLAGNNVATHLSQLDVFKQLPEGPLGRIGCF